MPRVAVVESVCVRRMYTKKIFMSVKEKNLLCEKKKRETNEERKEQSEKIDASKEKKKCKNTVFTPSLWQCMSADCRRARWPACSWCWLRVVQPIERVPTRAAQCAARDRPSCSTSEKTKKTAKSYMYKCLKKNI